MGVFVFLVLSPYGGRLCRIDSPELCTLTIERLDAVLVSASCADTALLNLLNFMRGRL